MKGAWDMFGGVIIISVDFTGVCVQFYPILFIIQKYLPWNNKNLYFT